MNHSVVGWIVAFALAFAGSVLAWVWFAGGSGEPSTELTTPTIAGAATTAAADTSRTFVIDPSRSVPVSRSTRFSADLRTVYSARQIRWSVRFRSTWLT